MTPVYKLSANSVKNGRTVYGSMLAGNPVYVVPTDFESIATVNGTGSSGVITFTNIPSTFKHLQIRGIAKSDSGVPAPELTFNSDTGTNYARHRLIGSGTAASAFGEASTTKIPALGNAGLPSATSTYGVFVYDILDYANTNKYKTIRVFSGQDSNGSGGVDFTSGLWMNTAAVSTITLTLSSNNYTTLSTFALYGIKGA